MADLYKAINKHLNDPFWRFVYLVILAVFGFGMIWANVLDDIDHGEETDRIQDVAIQRNEDGIERNRTSIEDLKVSVAENSIQVEAVKNQIGAMADDVRQIRDHLLGAAAAEH